VQTHSAKSFAALFQKRPAGGTFPLQAKHTDKLQFIITYGKGRRCPLPSFCGGAQPLVAKIRQPKTIVNLWKRAYNGDAAILRA
ncbi:MAG: hypothetical protein J6D16_03910, partial [Clostridia bacterium]|nr:hypothetical protein [Clostridia bacterium]